MRSMGIQTSSVWLFDAENASMTGRRRCWLRPHRNIVRGSAAASETTVSPPMLSALGPVMTTERASAVMFAFCKNTVSY